MLYKLHNIRKSKVWQEAYNEGRAEAEVRAYRKLIEHNLKRGLSRQEVAELLFISLDDLERYLAKT